MKFYDIALFLFIINIIGMWMVSFSQELGYSAYALFSEPKASELQEMESKINQAVSTEEITGSDPVTYALGIMYEVIKKAILPIFDPLKPYIFWLPYLMINFGVPSALAYGVGSIYYLIMIIGLAQMITGRSFMGVE